MGGDVKGLGEREDTEIFKNNVFYNQRFGPESVECVRPFILTCVRIINLQGENGRPSRGEAKGPTPDYVK
jgi:hypothetical protein